MKHSQCCFFFLLIFFLVGCEKYYITVNREFIDRSHLASTYVGSPDPLQKNPPTGQELIIEWHLPSKAVEEPLTLVLSLLYQNHSQSTLFYPVNRRYGSVVYSLLNEEYEQTGGLLTYKVEIVSADKTVIKEWKQVLWTDLITLDH